MNIAGQIFDIYDDPKLSIVRENKEKLAGISVLDPKEIQALPDEKFALIIKTANRKIRKYPMADEESIKLSKLYFENKKQDMHPELAKAASAGFEGKTNVIEIDKIADTEPVLSWRNYPINNESNVRAAMEKFAYTTQRFHPREKHAYANAISKEAQKYGVDPSGPVTGYINGKINYGAVKIACLMRKHHIFDSSMREDLDKIAETPNPEAFVEFDKVAGLTHYVSEGKIPDGYETCYSRIKTAQVDSERIREISPTVIERLFDSEFAREWALDPIAVYNSLPTPTKAMIDKQASYFEKDAAAMLPPSLLKAIRAAKDLSQKTLPAASLILAGGAAYATGDRAVIKTDLDKQFDAKGWVPSKVSGVIYEKNFEMIVQSGNKFAVLDKDGRERLASDDLKKLIEII